MRTPIPKTKDYRERLAKHPAKAYLLRPLDAITHIAVHHSLTASGSAESFARYHVKTNGWPGIGYHFVIEKDGTVKWCHDLEVRSYHVGKSNGYTIGICVVGDFREQELLPVQLDPLIYLLKHLMKDLFIDADRVLGHFEFPGYSRKECPGFNMEAIRAALGSKLQWQDTNLGLKELILDPNLVVTRPGETVISAIRKLNQGDQGEIRSRNKTLDMHKPNPEPVVVKSKGPREVIPDEINNLIKTLENKGYKVFKEDTKPYNINIVGIRSNNRNPNSFDDEICLFWNYENRWNLKRYKVTTDPGLVYLLDPLSDAGTAILKEGQYRSGYRIGLHQNRYTALVQAQPVTVIRDFNRDKILDYDSGREQTGFFGINIHRASATGESTWVDKWSAGCQVFANINQYNEFLKFCKLATANWGSQLTYTLISQ